jgi:hypothetical protein
MKEMKKYTLLTWEEFEKKFKPISVKWTEIYDPENGEIVYIDIKLNGGPPWLITKKSVEEFGTTVEVYDLEFPQNFTHTNKEKTHRYHESWFKPEFKPIEFLTKEDIEL